ncbi:MAG: putative oxidoreductase [Phycisphaerales bacterium]|nr:putative oxidoreductase [Phycisphaerales bacterium]
MTPTRPRGFRATRFFALAAALTAPALAVPGSARGQQGAPAAAAQPVRSVADVKRDLAQADQELSDALPTIDLLYDPAKRAAAAPKALPPMRRMTRLFEEYAKLEPKDAAGVAPTILQFRGWLAVLGDQAADDDLRRLTLSNDPAEATAAKAWVLVAGWVKAAGNAPAQEKLVGELATLAKARPDLPALAQVGGVLSETAATPALAQQVERTVADDLRGPAAEGVAATLGARRRFKALENQPLVVEGRALDGSKFSTAGWKGKVVLVDFWATWCPQCRADMPNLAAAYAAHHKAGLEVVGVSSDRDADDLKGFLAEHKEVAWPQLFDPASPNGHPLMTKYGVPSTPTYFLIDRKGVVRSVRAQENYKDLIPKLLAEKD